ncbi:MAG: putative ABC transporter permease [Bacilli bacterium]|nr:putative ABC transporter permease [Bacilli bacterium]
MDFFRICIIFLLGGLGGFVLEFFFRRFVSFKRWVKPGFLVGPFIPLYAFGLSVFYILCRYSPLSSLGLDEYVEKLLVTLIVGVMATVLEFIAGLFFVKVFHLRLWDYSHRRGNIMGIICPAFSLIWIGIAAIYVFFLHDAFSSFVDILLFYDGTNYGEGLIGSLFALGIIMGILLIDVCYSFSVASRLKKMASRIALNFDTLKTMGTEAKRKASEAFAFTFPFATRNADSFKSASARFVEESEVLALKLSAKKAEIAQVRKMKKEERLASSFKK